MASTYTVVSGDTLWSIASRKLGSGTRWTYLADLNGISRSRPIIRVGQVLKLSSDSGSSGSGSSSGGSTTLPEVVETPNTSNKVEIQYFGLQAGTDSTIFVVWKWDRENTDSFKVRWTYDAGNEGIWFVGTDATVESDFQQATYSAPSNAKRVRVTVRPESKKRNVNGNETSYWTAEWSTAQIYDLADNPPVKPEVPDVEIKDFLLRATLDNITGLNATSIQFQVVKDNLTVFKTSDSTIQYADSESETGGFVTYTCYVDAGSEYKVRCRSRRGTLASDWTDYSSNQSTKPSASSGILTIKANSSTSVYLDWGAVTSATAYEIEYSTKEEYFDSSNETTTIGDIKNTHYEVTGLETGHEYFFRVRATNDQGESAWTEIKSVPVGKVPVAPTTWSSTTTCITGETLTLYWVHNCEDNSTQTYADIELYIGGVKETHTVRSVDEEDDEKTMHFTINTSEYVEGTKIQWRVRTAGVTKEYGEWSIQRTVDIYSPVTLSFKVTDSSGEIIEILSSYPFYMSAVAGPNTQEPIGYHVTISANEAYESVDSIGNVQFVKAGEEVYSKHFDTSEDLALELSAGHVNLENNISYTASCRVSMNSGLTADETATFTVGWTDEQFSPNAEVSIDKRSLTASIRPYCMDADGKYIEGITLSVYRREFDGRFTELMTGINNTSNTYITDPHPALDYARYRIVAVTDATGAVSYYDMPGYPIGETSIIIQWDEKWNSFDHTDDMLEEPTWSGSLLRLPYNVNVSDTNRPDVSLVNYIGRAHPVAYYGTQLGSTSTWSTVIPKTDTETLYALRRLAIWPGNAYVREPSGSGYWANVSVTFSQKHREVTIPITLNITRVEGGA